MVKTIIVALASLFAIGCEQPVPPPTPTIIQIVSPTIDQRKETALKEYHTCMDKSDDFYHTGWDVQCTRVYHLKPKCILPSDTSMFVVERTKIFKQDCQNEFNNKIKLIE
jgi:hypothetical protein